MASLPVQSPMVPHVPQRFTAKLSRLRALMLVGVASLVLSGCAANRATSMASPDFSGQSRAEVQASLSSLAARYRQDPRDVETMVFYSAALRSVGQAGQAVAVLEAGIEHRPGEPSITIAYAKALAAAGRFEQALNVIEGAIRPEQPDWNALSVKGAILDQTGRNGEARSHYAQALTIAPQEASLEANLGLSFAMTNDLALAERHLRRAVAMRGANSQIRQNLALVVGLQGRFEECRALFSAELTPPQVEANMAYIRALLTQQDRWQAIEAGEG